MSYLQIITTVILHISSKLIALDGLWCTVKTVLLTYSLLFRNLFKIKQSICSNGRDSVNNETKKKETEKWVGDLCADASQHFDKLAWNNFSRSSMKLKQCCQLKHLQRFLVHKHWMCRFADSTAEANYCKQIFGTFQEYKRSRIKLYKRLNSWHPFDTSTWQLIVLEFKWLNFI